MENLENEFLEQINAALDLCDATETPTICSMLSTEESRESIVRLVAKTVLNRKMDIQEAIVQIENEFDPNSID